MDPPARPEQLPRLDISGMRAPWRLWKQLRGADHRRGEVGRLFNANHIPRDLARAQIRTLVDLGLWNDASSMSKEELEWKRRSLGYSVYGSANSGLCDAQMLHMAFEGGLSRDWNEQNNRFDTWTTIFARTGQDQCLRASMAAGCDVLVRDSCEETALHFVLKRACATLDATTRIRSLELAAEIVQAGHDIDSPGKKSNRFAADRGNPVLKVPVEAGNTEITRWLLERGARTDVADGYGDFPMHWLATTHFEHKSHAWSDVAGLIMQHGASLDVANPRGETPLWLAVAWGNVPAVEWLIKAGADITIDPKIHRDSQGYEKPNQHPVSLLMNVCKHLAPADPVALRLAQMILQAKPGAWDEPTPEGPTIREWLSTKAGPWRALHDQLCLQSTTPEPVANEASSRPLRF